ncbi:MAG: hypothetical protein HZA92_14710 [Verrucomicrobia bacterium]|nr:hypothetical protein [Verrucomicrobiota bacterium]
MNDPLEKLPSKMQGAVVALFIVPWAAFGLLTTDLLPSAWRFDSWPETARVISSIAFGVFVVAETVFSFWYFLGHEGKAEE